MEKRVIADDNNLSVKPNVRLKYNFLTKEILFDLYINKQLSTVDISKKKKKIFLIPYNDIVRTHTKV